MSIFKDGFPFVEARTPFQPLPARSEAPYPRANQLSSITKTLLRVVQLTGIIILIACLHVSAGIDAQERISINMKAAPLEKIFAEIEARSGYTVFYNTEVLKFSGGPITIEMKDATISDVMKQCLKGLPLEYSIQDKTIFVKHVNHTAAAADSGGPGKNGATPSTVSGIVQTEAGMPLVGATVYIRRLKKTGVTDAKGEFAMKDVPDGEYEVDISYVGFERLTTKITVVNHEAVFSAALKQMMSKLDETVVKGYYTTTNRLNTGDVTTVKGDDIQKQPVSDPILALEGRVPGLNIQQASGVPGSYSAITIRGVNSIANGNDPLYIVDGVPFSSLSMTSTYYGGGAVGKPNGVSNVVGTGANYAGTGMSPFNMLNPADIESVEVLKDADATAIYGSRGANGVILITTRKGKAGKTKFDLNVYTGGGKVTRTMNLLNTLQYLEMRREAFSDDGLAVPSIISSPKDNNYDIDGVWDTTRYTNWQKALIGNSANFTNAQGSLSGGNVNTQFLIGGGYSRQGTVYPGNYSDQKASVNISLTHASEDHRFHSQFNSNYVNDNSNLPTLDFATVINMAPDAPALYDANGNLNWQMLNGSKTFNNPLAKTFNQAMAVTGNLISNLKLAYAIIPGLELKGNFGYNHVQMNQNLLSPATTNSAPPYNLSAYSSNQFITTDLKSWIIEPQINFERKIGQGQLDALIGSTFQQNSNNTISQQAYGFANDALITDPLAASQITLTAANSIPYHYEALYGRLSYIWQEKYLINLTARRDGSSRFGPGKQFGNFGAVGVGWIFSKEKVIEQALPVLSFGKLRASYGTTGNDQIPDYQYLSTYSPGTTSYQGISGLSPTSLTNPFFAWEVDKKLEVGLELGFIKDRILVQASYFRNRTGNQLVGYPLPHVTGFGAIQYNLPAVVQNTGIELTLNTINLKSNSITWTSALNLTVPNNKLVAFPGLASTSYNNMYVVGQSLLIQHSFHNTGVNPQSGIYSFVTKNTNGFPTSPQDTYVTKPVTQKFYGGFQNSISYKSVRLDFLIQYVNQLGRNYMYYFQPPGIYNNNEPTAVLSRWQKPGDFSGIQEFGTSLGKAPNIYYSYLQRSDAIISDASFIRLKNLSISYEIPVKWMERLHFQNARIYIQGQNLFTITNYLGLDPESGGLNLPPLKMLTAGVQLGL